MTLYFSSLKKKRKKTRLKVTEIKYLFSLKFQFIKEVELIYRNSFEKYRPLAWITVFRSSFCAHRVGFFLPLNKLLFCFGFKFNLIDYI